MSSTRLSYCNIPGLQRKRRPKKRSSTKAVPEGVATPLTLESLPLELIVQIIRHCLPQNVDRSGRKTFMVVRSVCSEWRELCFSTPDLWSSLFLDLFSRNVLVGGDVRGDVSARLKQWYNRAGPVVPLSLDFRASAVSVRTVEMDSIIQMIIDYRQRWRRLTLSLHPSLLDRIFSRPPKEGEEWTQLEELEIKMGLYPRQLGVFNNMPSLRSLSLGSLFPDTDAARGQMNPSPHYLQIQHLTIITITSYVFDLHDYFPALTELTLKLTGFDEPQSSHALIPHMTFNSLRSLSIVGKREVGGLMDKFTCPSLTQLALEYSAHRPEDGDAMKLEHVARFLSRSNIASLEGWNLNGYGLSDLGSQKACVLHPAMTSVGMKRWPFTAPLNEGRIDTEFQGLIKFLPNVEVITFTELGDSLVLSEWGEVLRNGVRRMESFIRFMEDKLEDATTTTTSDDESEEDVAQVKRKPCPIPRVVICRDVPLSDSGRTGLERLLRKGISVTFPMCGPGLD